jgi:hypothetical protein
METSYKLAFIELMAKRDWLYIELFAVVVVSWAWYRLWFKSFFKLILGAAFLVILAALIWGLLQLDSIKEVFNAWVIYVKG